MRKQAAAAKATSAGDAIKSVDEIRVLNRISRRSADGLEYEPDQRHVEILIAELGLENAKPVGTHWDAHSSNVVAAALGSSGGFSAAGANQGETDERNLGQVCRETIAYVESLMIVDTTVEPRSADGVSAIAPYGLPLGVAESNRFRSMAARCNYLAVDRADIPCDEMLAGNQKTW